LRVVVSHIVRKELRITWVLFKGALSSSKLWLMIRPLRGLNLRRSLSLNLRKLSIRDGNSRGGNLRRCLTLDSILLIAISERRGLLWSFNLISGRRIAIVRENLGILLSKMRVNVTSLVDMIENVRLILVGSLVASWISRNLSLVYAHTPISWLSSIDIICS